MTNSADPDQLASSEDMDLHCLQRQGVSGLSRTRVNFYVLQYPCTLQVGNEGPDNYVQMCRLISLCCLHKA